MYNFPDITLLISFAIGVLFGEIGLILAFVAGIWLALPSRAYLASFGVPAAIVGGWFQLTVSR